MCLYIFRAFMVDLARFEESANGPHLTDLIREIRNNRIEYSLIDQLQTSFWFTQALSNWILIVENDWN